MSLIKSISNGKPLEYFIIGDNYHIVEIIAMTHEHRQTRYGPLDATHDDIDLLGRNVANQISFFYGRLEHITLIDRRKILHTRQ